MSESSGFKGTNGGLDGGVEGKSDGTAVSVFESVEDESADSVEAKEASIEGLALGCLSALFSKLAVRFVATTLPRPSNGTAISSCSDFGVKKLSRLVCCMLVRFSVCLAEEDPQTGLLVGKVADKWPICTRCNASLAGEDRLLATLLGVTSLVGKCPACLSGMQVPAAPRCQDRSGARARQLTSKGRWGSRGVLTLLSGLSQKIS